MAIPGTVDYHIHYYLDACAADTMRLPAIERAALAMGLTEIGVLKHYSQSMPNGKADWAAWHTIDPAAFDRYLAEMHAYRPTAGLAMYTGVETELVDDAGGINIPAEDQRRLDFVALSVHYFPRMRCLPAPLPYHPVMQRDIVTKTPQGRAAMALWQEQVADVGAASIVQGLVAGYIGALERHPRIGLLAHLYDGLLPLRQYRVPCDDLPEATLIALLEPLMACMAARNVLWELCPGDVPHPAILTRASEMRVRFVATADAHFLGGSTWGNFPEHAAAEAYIDSLGLTKGLLTVAGE